MLKQCPRRNEHPLISQNFYSENDMVGESCTFCGSLDGDVFMARLEDGSIKLSPTDKNYKVYAFTLDDKRLFKTTYRTDDKPFAGWNNPIHDWQIRESKDTKFYFQHLNNVQKMRFIQLLNEKKIVFDATGYFYVLPFFIKKDK